MDSLTDWNLFYNNPHAGLQFQFNEHGNTEVLGYSFSLMPFFVINPTNHFLKSSHFKFAIGGSYFNKKYEILTNRANYSIGSNLVVAFEAGYYYALPLSDKLSLTAGVRYLHFSNGHTQLPNFGINSLQLSTGIQLLPVSVQRAKNKNQQKSNPSKDYYIGISQGLGWHELGDAVNPKYGPKYPIYFVSAFGSRVYHKSLRLKLGLTYRHYQSYYSYITNHQLEPYYSDSYRGASNVFGSLGVEMLFGHVGMELETGVNFSKPFYEEYNRIFVRGETTNSYVLRKNMPLRLGLNAYLIDTDTSPNNNLVVGAHINANWTVADFVSFSVSYIRKI